MGGKPREDRGKNMQIEGELETFQRESPSSSLSCQSTEDTSSNHFYYEDIPLSQGTWVVHKDKLFLKKILFPTKDNKSPQINS